MINLLGYCFGMVSILYGLYLLSLESFSMRGDLYTKSDTFYWVFVLCFIVGGIYLILEMVSHRKDH